MFSLIITIISIALVVALVAATMYYGGSALNQGTEKADAAAFVSGAQQITGAISLYTSLEGDAPVEDGADLLLADFQNAKGEKYLTSLPVVKGTETGKWALNATGELTHDVASKAVCQQLADKGGDLYTCAGTGAAAGDVGAAPFVFTFKF